MARDDNSWMDISKTLFGLAQQDFENKYNERKLQAALKQQEIENQIALLKEGYIPYKDPVENLGFQPMQGGISGVLSPIGINKPYIRPEVQPVDIPGVGKYTRRPAPMFEGIQPQEMGNGFGLELSGISSGKPRYTKDTQADIYKRASSLREEFNSLPLVKDYNEIYTKTKEMEGLFSASKKMNNPLTKQKNFNAIDQALITLFNKITDPQSVVRESEYARVGENLPVINRINVAFSKFYSGAQLTVEDREALVEAAKIISDETGNIYNETISSYEKIARDDARVDPNVVFGNRKKHSRMSKLKYDAEESYNVDDVLAGLGE